MLPDYITITQNALTPKDVVVHLSLGRVLFFDRFFITSAYLSHTQSGQPCSTLHLPSFLPSFFMHPSENHSTFLTVTLQALGKLLKIELFLQTRGTAPSSSRTIKQPRQTEKEKNRQVDNDGNSLLHCQHCPKLRRLPWVSLRGMSPRHFLARNFQNLFPKI